MLAQGAETLAEMDKISIFGLEGLLGSVREILAIRKNIYQAMLDWRADVFIGVDVPDFNLSLEKKLKSQGIPTVHYVSPTVWAWRTGRIKKIRSAIDLMLTLFPFEEPFYQNHGVPVAFVGHPLASEVLAWSDQSRFKQSLLKGSQDSLIALLPGSRMSEVSRLAPIMIEAAEQLSASGAGTQFVIPAANQRVYAHLESILSGHSSIELIDGRSRDLLSVCDLAVLASGTAALEAGMFGVPMIVMYKVSKISALVFGHTIRVEHFSMPNHLTDPPVVPELIQSEATVANLMRELSRLMNDEPYREDMRASLKTIAPALAKDSGKLAADAVLKLINRR